MSRCSWPGSASSAVAVASDGSPNHDALAAAAGTRIVRGMREIESELKDANRTLGQAQEGRQRVHVGVLGRSSPVGA
jgi:hypothetical protein